MKAILFCYSYHHGNTRKIADAIAAHLPVRVVSVPAREEINLNDYDLIGFASGIYMSEFGKPIHTLVDTLDGLGGKKCFTLYTCGAFQGKFDAAMQETLTKKGALVAGGWHCRGFDTFGPFKLVGGIAKGRPDEKDKESAVCFVKALLEV